MATKGVHWDYPSVSDVSSDVLATSSLDYINSQLVAHGFAPSPGLSLDGIASADLDRVVKCILGLLSQRIEDMARTEDLTTKLRTLSYDHERLSTMYRAAADTAANAERAANLHKSRLSATTRLLQSAESAHKQTTVELQRARSALQSVRATHHAEMKKKEKEVERMAERWTKLADMQAKVGAAGSGLRCANLKAVEGSGADARGTPSLEENALRQSEEARQRLGEDNAHLRSLLLGAVNEAQAMLYQARSPEREKDEEPAPITTQALFPISPADAANLKLASLLSSLRAAVHRPKPAASVPSSSSGNTISDGEVERLQQTIAELRIEVERYQKELLIQATETQEIFEQFANDPRIVNGDVRDESVDLMIAPERDAEKERLEKIKSQLDLERSKFTEATLKLGHERAAVDAERMKLEDLKRSWEVEKLLAELPPTPNPKSNPEDPKPLRSPRKSPAKVFTVGAARKTTRGPKRSGVVSPPRNARFQPAFETEVIPSTSLLPTSFVLPPPSPYSAFPAPLLLSSAPIPSLLDALTSPVTQPANAVANQAPPIPETPANLPKPFPMAKPLVPRMFHAYSPAKPSPLSRILLMSQQSPASPEEGAVPGFGMGLGVSPMPLLPPLPEEGLSAMMDGSSEELFPAIAAATPAPLQRELTLAEELGVTESPPSPEVVLPVPGRKVSSKESGRLTAVEKGKGRVVEKENGLGKTRASGSVAAPRRAASVPKPPPTTKSVSASAARSKTVGPGSARVMAKLPAASSAARKRAAKPMVKPASGDGPRRVLVDSAEAGVPRRRS
ncbi:hypothetical protein MKEN_01094900 [Mycena kentingensis (nom. inval.)]|nr:hypothetical protein MKEN_01094900 [Mycena kentingensis (nom. inval.)]